jgi:arabinose-5-phosphate isomerase
MTGKARKTARETPGAAADAAYIEAGRYVLAIEREALERASSRLGPTFATAVSAILESSGTVVVLGVGKSGIVARKIAATFASTGTAAVFLHPADAAHGDVGMVGRSDVAIAVSKSGEGEEILRIVPILKELGVPIIAITGEPESSLARKADVVLDAAVEREACPMDLVPTASTTAALALGDALAVVVLREKEVDRDLFATFHPGGAIGRRLLLKVSDVMHSGNDLPEIPETALMKDAIIEIANKRIGMTTVVNDAGKLVGMIADGDLKRILMVRRDILDARVSEVMTRDPRTIGRDELVAAALERMEANEPSPITSLIIVDSEGRPEGVIHIHDCLRAIGSPPPRP